MILAYATGMLIAVKFVKTKGTTTIVQEICDGTTFTVKADEENRKLFGGENAVEDATTWVEERIAEKKAAKKVV